MKVAIVLKYLLSDQGFSLQGASKKIENEGIERLFPIAWLRFSSEIGDELIEILSDLKEVRDTLRKTPPFFIKREEKSP